MNLSDKPFIANLTMKNGTKRRIDYVMSHFSGGFFAFFLDAAQKNCVMVNGDCVETVDMEAPAEPMGRA